MRLWVDADACPVKFEVLEVARRFGIRPVFVSHQPIKALQDHPSSEFVLCQSGPDSADDHILEHMVLKDVIVTSDLLLSQKVLEKGGRVINFFGKSVTSDSVGKDLGRKKVHALADQLGVRHHEPGGKPSKGNFKGAFHNLLDRMVGVSWPGP